MPKLTDTQAILLSTAAQRDSGSLYPLAATLKETAQTGRAVAGLLKSGLTEERETSDVTLASRQNGEVRIGVFITSAGLAAIGVEEPSGGEPASSGGSDAATPRTSKREQVIALLARESGATLAELIETTHWLPHTTRAALTGLRKAGHSIERSKRADETCYRIVAAAA
jgi:hypothetical protein